MRFFLALVLLIIIILTPSLVSADDITWIVQVEGDSQQIAEDIKQDYPFLEILYTYDTLIQAVAVKGAAQDIEALHQETWVTDYHRTQTYEAPTAQNQINAPSNSFPDYRVEATDATGQNVKIGVIDTGIDYTHPDISPQYQGGFDVIDLDDDPMESSIDDGVPTNHGTHVAGIIVANGDMKGVAPEADLYGYRALGPGGVGTSAHVLAALEQAVKDDMDIINLSLGTNVNSPDTPLSQAVNQAFDLGHVIVVASGNSGPDDWSVATPATAQNAITVGAGYTDQAQPVIPVFGHDPVPVRQIPNSDSWPIDERFPYKHVTTLDDAHQLNGQILMMNKGEQSYTQLITQVIQTEAEALIIVTDEEPNEWSLTPTSLPVIVLTEEEAQAIRQNETWIETTTRPMEDGIAEFSARGPVTRDWTIKPDILAPGINVHSTVPGGYASFQGTSMAAPYISGVLALLKQTNPDATPTQLKQQLLSHAKPFKQVNRPSEAGGGWLDVQSLFENDYYIESSQLHFGYHQADQASESQSVTVHNTGEDPLQVAWNIPKRHESITWELPFTTTIDPNAQETFTVAAHFRKKFIMKGVHEGYLSLELGRETVFLPYLMIGNLADYPRVSAELTIEPFKQNEAKLTYYVAESLKALTIDIYNDSFQHVETLTNQSTIDPGKYEKTIDLSSWSHGKYYVIIQADDGRQTYDQSLEFTRP